MKYDVSRPKRLCESLSKHYYFKITLKLKASNIYIKVNLYRVLLKTTRANLLEMACLECFTTYGASIGGFPRASFFFSWSSPSIWSRQVKYRFIFSGLTDGLSILIPKISAIVFCVCFCKPLLNEIVEFQPNKKRMLERVFGDSSWFSFDKVAGFTDAISRMSENVSTVRFDNLGFLEDFSILWSPMLYIFIVIMVGFFFPSSFVTAKTRFVVACCKDEHIMFTRRVDVDNVTRDCYGDDCYDYYCNCYLYLSPIRFLYFYSLSIFHSLQITPTFVICLDYSNNCLLPFQ